MSEFGQHRPTSVLSSTLSLVSTNLGQTWPGMTIFDQTWPGIDQRWPDAKFGQISAKFSKLWPDIDKCGPTEVNQVWPNWARCWTNFGPESARFGPNAPAFGPMLTKSVPQPFHCVRAVGRMVGHGGGCIVAKRVCGRTPLRHLPAASGCERWGCGRVEKQGPRRGVRGKRRAIRSQLQPPTPPTQPPSHTHAPMRPHLGDEVHRGSNGQRVDLLRPHILDLAEDVYC